MPTVVVKVGTSSIIRGDSGHLALSTLASLVETLTSLRRDGHNVILVSSGAVGVGCQRMGVTTRPKGIAELQAMAAIGQPHLMHHYEGLFRALGQPIAQVLLTVDTLSSRSNYSNAQATFEQLLAMGVIPVVNENDSVAVNELRFGDNDTLSALVATLVGAEWLFLATDVDALYTSNPNSKPKPGEPPAEAIREVHDIGAALRRVEAAGGNAGSQWGTGGIATKLRAGQLASAAGVTTTICHAQRPTDIAAVMGGSLDVGTRLMPSAKLVRSHKRWIMALPPRGELHIDAGAARAIGAGGSLFAAGLRAQGVVGDFGEQDAVRVIDEGGKEIARALMSYSSEQALKIIGRRSEEISGLLGFHGPDELVARNNIVVIST